MKILMLVNWKIEYCNSVPKSKQPPDYCIKGEDYWFYRYFKNKPEVDVIDISSFPALENFEKNKLHFYIHQGLKAVPRLDKYDLVVSHGMPSAVIVALWQHLFKKRVKHIVFDIGCFNSAAESGRIMKIMQKISKSIDGIIYHTKCQKEYYEKYYPWLVDKSEFIRFGTDIEFFDNGSLKKSNDYGKYIVCIGASRRDWDTLIKAYKLLDTDIKLKIIGHTDEKYNGIKGVKQIPFIPVTDMINQIYNARLCVLPLESFNYSYGQMTFLQQMALGKCVIAANVPSLNGYAEDKKTAVFYEAKNENSLADTVNFVLDNPKEEAKIISNARDYLKNECNERIMAEQIENFYLKILKN